MIFVYDLEWRPESSEVNAKNSTITLVLYSVVSSLNFYTANIKSQKKGFNFNDLVQTGFSIFASVCIKLVNDIFNMNL